MRFLWEISEGFLFIEDRGLVEARDGQASTDALRQWWEFVGFAAAPPSLTMTPPPISPSHVRLEVARTQACLVSVVNGNRGEHIVVHGDRVWSDAVLREAKVTVVVCEGVLPGLSRTSLESAAQANGLLVGWVTAGRAPLPARRPARRSPVES